MSKIVLFGATGYTGRLTAAALRARGVEPLLAARNRSALASVATDIGGADTAVADVTDPASVRALLESGDVLISTVGPFLRYGRPALDAALDAGAHYLDSTGEGPFIRAVFDRDAEAREKNIGLLSAFGFDYVPGNLAAGLVLADTPAATGVRICYGIVDPGTSGGTRASMAGMMFEPGFSLRDGRLRPARLGERVHTFTVNGASRTAASIPASEHLALPHSYPELRDIDVYLSSPPAAARALQIGTRVTSIAAQIAPLKALGDAVLSRAVKGSTGGPTAEQRASTSSWIVAEALDANGAVLASTTLTGVDPYTFTASILAWGAAQALSGALRAVGALGPVDGFGLEELTAGAAEAGLTAQ
ncbi:saccharopine dehydrogenase NADP-binding domain-containing protein [Gordonia sp. N1V]|uniref:saccharopine dehydrogenase family protein n=1 Tax=Gordonia sp. N1V TaxID=3034163 RepID=UPI0023E1C251|nr:saccharopine dehydrogenase NADP-binding domain-containing protein [Gordonia sp. N1V]MDF3283825.1 saccharopine dehydrogenase NADP-binding domain-containing protein [Gordonia sp. N1V]